MAVANVVARFTADTGDFHRKMGEAQKSFGSVADAATMSSRAVREFGEGMAKAGQKLTIGVTLPLGGAGAAAVAAAMSFETAMSRIVGLVGIAADEVSNMGDEVLNMASGVGKSPDELAGGLFVITSAGLRGAEAMQTLRAAAMAGAAGLGETNDIARAVSGALSAYGSEVLSASEATDAIVATARAGNFETSQFAAAIGRVLPFAQQAGASFQDMGGAVALLTRVNGNAAESITQMQALFRAFVVPTEEAKKALDEVGLSAGDLRASIAEKGLPATLQMLDKALGGNREQLGRLLGSSEAASAAFQILNADANTINDTFGVVQDSAGMTIDAFGAVAETTQFQLSQAMNELKAGMIEVGESLLPVVQAIIDFADRWIKAFNSLPGPVKNIIVGMAALAAAIGPVLFIAGKLIVVFSTLLSFMLKMKAFQALRTAFANVRTDMARTRTSVAQTRASFGLLGTSAKYAQLTVISSFKAIGTAAKGLVASFGPIGLALVGVTVILDTFMGRAAAMNDIIESLRDEVDLTEQALTRAGEKLAAQKIFELISPEDRAALEAYGISMAEVLEAVINGGPAMEELQDKLAGFRDLEANPFGRMGADSIRQDIELVREGVVGSIESANSLAEANANAALRTSDAARSMKGAYREAAAAKREADRNMTDSQRAVDAALEAGIEAVEALEAAFTNMQDALSDEASVDKAYRSINRLNEELKEGDKSIKGYSDAALDNRQAIRDAAQAWIDYAAATDDPEESQKRLAEGQKEIKEALEAADLDPNQSNIFKMFKNQRKESKQTVDEFAEQRDKARQYGNDVGANFIDGIIAELNRRRDEVAAAAANNTSALNTGGNAGIDASSPSRTAMEIAGNWTDGLIVGMRSRSSEVEGEASKVAQRIAAALRASGVKDSDIEMFLGAMNDLPASVTDIMQMAVTAVGETDYTSALEKSFDRSVKAGAPMTADAMERMAEGASQKAKERLGLTLEPELKAIIETAGRNLQAPATNAGRPVGTNIVSGMASGITATSWMVEAAVARVVANAKAAADAAAESSSPSRLFAESGDDMMSGVALGITRSTRKVTKAAEKSVKALNRQFMNRVERLFVEIAKAIDEGMKNATEAAAERLEEFRNRMMILDDVLRDWREFATGVTRQTPTLEQSLNRVDRLFVRLRRSADVKNVTDRSVASFRKLATALQNELQNALSIAQDNLAQMEDAFNDLQSTVANAIRGVVSFADAESIGEELGIGFLEGLRRQVEDAAAFAAIIDELRRQGLSEAALREIINAGAEAGTKIGSELIAGGAEAISEANDLIEQVESIAETIGTETAEAFYGAGVEAARQQVEGILDQIDRMTPRIMRWMDRLARKMARKARIDVELSRTDFTVTLNVDKVIREVSAEGATFRGAALAAGGIVQRPTIALVGEAGPEAVVPLSQAGRYGLGESKSFTIENLTINPAPGERAEETVPRALRRLAFSMGFDD